MLRPFLKKVRFCSREQITPQPSNTEKSANGNASAADEKPRHVRRGTLEEENMAAFRDEYRTKERNKRFFSDGHQTKTLQDVIQYVNGRREEIESEEIIEFVKDHPDLGLASLSVAIYDHKKSETSTPLFDTWGLVVILCLVTTLSVQLIVPPAIFSASFYSYYAAIYPDEDNSGCIEQHGEMHCPEEKIYADNYFAQWACPPNRYIPATLHCISLFLVLQLE